MDNRSPERGVRTVPLGLDGMPLGQSPARAARRRHRVDDSDRDASSLFWRRAYVIAAVVGLGLIASESQANALGRLLCLLVGLLLAVAWLVRAIGPRDWSRAESLKVSSGLPLVLLLCFAVAESGAPFRVRFELSRPAFEDARLQVETSGPIYHSLDVGLMPVGDAERVDGGDFFAIPGAGLLASCGIGYWPAGVKPQRFGQETDLGGGWWFACYSGG